MKASKIAVLSALAVTSTAVAGTLDRPGGIKIGQHMTLRPYVSLSYTYDSNIDCGRHAKSGSQWNIKPGLNLDYKDDNWNVTAGLYYQYHAYNRYVRQLNSSTFGESLALTWVDAPSNEEGWRLKLSQSYRMISQDDDMSETNGRGIGRDRQEFRFNGTLQRRLNKTMYARALGSYYMLDYDNNIEKYATLYGWKRATLGGEFAFAPAPKVSFILHGAYQWYWQDNDARGIGSESRGYTLQAGIGSYLDERITYRLLGGLSHFEYGGGVYKADGFTYQGSLNWKLDDFVDSISALGSSYYQPSERDVGTAVKVYTFSVGARKHFIKRKVGGTFDFAYRHESHEYSASRASAYDTDVWTIRAGLSYNINRFASLFGRLEYQLSEPSGAGSSKRYDYDRYRGTVGVTLKY